MIKNEYKILESIIDGNIVLSYEENSTSNDYNVIFSYGRHVDLQKFLKSFENKLNGNIYPLIWLESHFVTEGGFPFAKANCKFILATNSNEHLLNRDRTDQSFVKNLDIVLNDLIKLLSSSKAKIINKDKIKVKRFFNYNTDTQIQSQMIWDAITLECLIEFNYNC